VAYYQTAEQSGSRIRLVALEGLPARAGAERLGMRVAMVRLARTEVRRMLAEERRKLEGLVPE
jgi:hypothetical protein